MIEVVLKIVLAVSGVLCLIHGLSTEPGGIAWITAGVVLLALAGIWVFIVDGDGDIF